MAITAITAPRVRWAPCSENKRNARTMVEFGTMTIYRRHAQRAWRAVKKLSRASGLVKRMVKSFQGSRATISLTSASALTPCHPGLKPQGYCRHPRDPSLRAHVRSHSAQDDKTFLE